MKIRKKNPAKTLHTDQPVPMISDDISTFIVKKLKEENYDFMVEFGAGNSTRYFLARLIEYGKRCTFISVEYNYNWFKTLVNLIKADLKSAATSNEKFILKRWTYEKCKRYLDGKNATALNVPGELRHLPKAKKALGGPLYTKILLQRLREESRPIDGCYSITIDISIKLLLILRSDFMKDQYGESPIKQEYLEAALEPIKQKLLSAEKITAVFLIDGGPRGDVVNAILDLEERYSGFCPTIFLCDAYRSFYAGPINRRPSGVFIKGSNRTLNGEAVYKRYTFGKKTNFWVGKASVSPDELAKKEVWFYQP